MLRRACIAVAGFFLLTSAAFSQDFGRFDASFNGAAVFTKTSTGSGVQQSATIGANYFGTFRVQMRGKHSFLFDYGRARNSQIYQTGFDFHVLTSISEISGAWMYRPLQIGRFEPFFQLGGGVLRFKPSATYLILPPVVAGVPNNILLNLNTVQQSEAAFLYGGGVDYRLLGRFALRLQYRGFVYGNPNFKVNPNTNGAISFVTSTKGHMAEPSIGLVFRF
jgi:opacity protein-like surface antigen